MLYREEPRAAAEPCHPFRRDYRPTLARGADGQPGHPARCARQARHRPLAAQELGLLCHRVPRSPSRGDAAPGSPTRYTALFFWDEVSALAAGHRPCGECRNADWRRFKAAWAAAGLPGWTAAEIDRVLHTARVTRTRQQVTHEAELAVLPDGVFLTLPDAPDAPLLKWRGQLWLWRPERYETRGPAGRGRVRVLTPAPTVAAISAGYAPTAALP